METRTVEQVKSWNTRSFADGYAGLRELSNGEFSGAVRAGGAWLFMLNGRIIGVYEGSLDDFEDADGTAYAAPHPSLPLLFSMKEQGGETQAKYYTNDTPLSEVDSTLTSGSFTGYVELSENVLSGDYYVAYYGGRSMSVAFVGASEQVVTGEEAFERANDEVGIYEVRDVDIEVTDVPEPEEPDTDESDLAGGASDAGGTDASSAGASSTSTSASGTDASGTSTSSPETSGASAGDAANDSNSDDATGGAGTESGRASGPQSATSHIETAEPSAETDQSRPSNAAATDDGGQTGAETETNDSTVGATGDAVEATDASAQTTDANASARTETGASARTGASEREGASGPASASDRANATEPREDTSPGPASPSATSPKAASNARPDATSDPDDEGSEEADGAFADEEEWRETTTIPSLDPDRSEGPDGAASESSANASGEPSSSERASAKSASRSGDRRGTDRPSGGRSNDRSRSSAAGTNQSSSASGTNQSSSASGRSASESETDATPTEATGAGRASEANGPSGSNGAGSHPSESGEASDEAKERIQKLRSQLKQRKQQVQQLKSRLSDVESERNEYKRERDALRQEVERLEAKLETGGSGANGSSKRRLDPAQAFDGTNLFVRYESKGKATLDEAAEGKVEANDVNGNLRLEHHTQFDAEEVEVAGEAFESFLTDSFEYRFVSWIIEELLYEIRDTGHRTSLTDLYESIPKIDRVDLHGSVSAGSGDDDTRQESFDIIMRDRMGNPLVVADLNDSRDPTTGEMMGSLVDAASGVAGTYDELSGAFQVTESFFEPEALETTESATSGGFLSREKRESFVKLSRKRGYHLCLVESRSGGFHLNVPEL